MKKLTILMLGVLMLMGIATSAYAAHLEATETESGLRFGGELRVRGVYQDNHTDYNADLDDVNRMWDQRIRLRVDALTKSGIEVNTRLTTGNNTWDGGAAYGLSMEYGYVTAPVGSVKLIAGKYYERWGNRLMSWDTAVDRAMIVYEMGDMSIEAYIQKDDEAGAIDGSGDTDSYSIAAKSKMGDLMGGAILVQTIDDAADMSGTLVDAYVNGMMGGMGLMAELAYGTGDLYDGSIGFGAEVSQEIAGLMARAVLGYASNGFTADDNYTPTNLIGTTHANAIMDFGAVADDTAMIIGAGADMGVNDNLTVGALVAYDNLSSENSMSLIEVDVTARYMIAKNLNYEVKFGYGMPSEDLGSDAVMVLAHGLYLNF